MRRPKRALADDIQETIGFVFVAVAIWLVILVVAWAIVFISVRRTHAEEHQHVHPTEVITGATGEFYATWKRPDMPHLCANAAKFVFCFKEGGGT